MLHGEQHTLDEYTVLHILKLSANIVIYIIL